MNPRVKKILQITLPLIAGLTILYLLYQSESAKYAEECVLKGIPDGECSLVQKIKDDIYGANYFWIAMIVLLFMISNVFRALRWQMLLRPLGIQASFSNAFWTLMAGYLVNLGIPRTGEFARAGLLARYENASFDKIFGTIVTGRLIDVVFLGVFVLLSLVFEFDRLWDFISARLDLDQLMGGIVDRPWLILLIVIGAAIIGYYLWRALASSELVFFQKIRAFVLGVVDGILSIGKVASPSLFVGYSLGIWICYYLMTYWGFFSFEPTAHLDMVAGLVSFVLGTIGFIFPSPGGMGSYHFMLMEALNLYGIESTQAFSFANILYFSVQIFGTIIFGTLAFLCLPLANRDRS